MESVLERFLRYVRVDSQSDPASGKIPSSPGQLVMGKMLLDELRALGLADAAVDANGFVTASLPANIEKAASVVGFIAHMDTAPGFPADGAKPQIVDAYDGGVIPFSGAPGFSLSPVEFPELLEYTGKQLVITDGTTLLGADDKAGVAEIMAALETLVKNPAIPHGTVKVAFTPDEEIGSGGDHFDVAAFGADFAYTLDGGEPGDLNFETFNAAALVVHVQGRATHPGSAKGRMINALQVAHEFHQRLPEAERPEHTDGYEGFYHIHNMEGSDDRASMTYILRDHDRAKFEARKQFVVETAAELNHKYGAGTVTLDLSDTYYNMAERLRDAMYVVDIAAQAMRLEGIEPMVRPVRGGTDGSKFSFKGLPTPNIFSGGYNFHGRHEFIPVENMEKAVRVVLRIVELVNQRG